MISGTTGLLGCADGALLMQKEKRTDSRATLEVVGRDQPDQRLYLSKDQESLVWGLDHAENELWKQPPDPVLEAVAKIVSADNREWEGSPTELAQAIQTDMAVNRLTKHLNVNASRLLEEHQVKYENKTKHAGRRIRLTYMVVEARRSQRSRRCFEGCSQHRCDRRHRRGKKKMGWYFATPSSRRMPHFRTP